MNTSLLVLTLTTLTCCLRADELRDHQKAQRPPNLVFLLADDLRPDTIRALGNTIIHTPNLDALVKNGTAFTRAVSPNPVCVPSRAEILTGCSGFRNGVLPGYSDKLDPKLAL